MDSDKRVFRRGISAIVLCVLSVILISSCRTRKPRKSSQTNIAAPSVSKFKDNKVANELESLFEDLEIEDSVWQKGKVYDIHTAMQKAYQDEDYYPIWLTDDGDTSYVIRLLQDLDSLKFDGFKEDRYHTSEIKTLLQKYSAAKNASVEEVVHLDTLCTRGYLQASRDLLQGALVPASVDSLWFHANDSVWQPYVALSNMGKGDVDYLSLDSFRSKIVTYSLLRKALMWYEGLSNDSTYIKAKHAITEGAITDSAKNTVIASEIPWDIMSGNLTSAYQYYIGASNYSKKDSMTRVYLTYPIDTLRSRIALNMERLRWMQQSFEPKHVLVNVPLLELFFRIDGVDSMHMEVVVGKTVRQTPSLNARMANVVINPTWGVPPTIMVKDVLPGMAKKGKAYLKEKGLRVYDHKGNEVNSSVVNANNYKKYVFRQDAGDDNALGYVKFNLPNKWDIYLHDTPHREDFGKKDRFQSSGCIRVQQPKELAEFILTQLEGRRYPVNRIDSVIEIGKTRFEVLKNRIPVHIVYLTAFEDSTAQHFHLIYDMYKRDGALKAALQ